VDTTEYQPCIDQGGDWFAGETCPEFQCPLPPEGACCVDEQCVATTTADDCAAQSGTWFFGETCPDFACPLELTCPDGSMLDQPATAGTGTWAGVTSDLDAGYIVYDNYAVGESIGAIKFWGIQAFNDGINWYQCEEAPLNFTIEMYPDDGTGKPNRDNPTCSYSVSLTGVPTGTLYLTFPLYVFETDLAPACDLLNGWIAVIGADGATCWFLWANTQNGDGTLYWQYDITAQTWDQTDAYELGFCLTSGGGGCVPNPDVNGDGCVDVGDLVEVIVNWGQGGPYADVNCDGFVDVGDLVAVILAWGQGC
jgi:hypothetical protein